MNGFSWFPEARTIWDRSRRLRPQGVGHDQGQPVGSPYLFFFSAKLLKQKLKSRIIMNDFSWFPGSRTIWDRSRRLRPQGVGHDQGQPVGSPDLVFQQSC